MRLIIYIAVIDLLTNSAVGVNNKSIWAVTIKLLLVSVLLITDWGMRNLFKKCRSILFCFSLCGPDFTLLPLFIYKYNYIECESLLYICCILYDRNLATL